MRTERGPRQNVVARLGALDEAGRLGVLQAARCIDNDPVSIVDSPKFFQQSHFEFEDTPVEPRWVRVNTNAVRSEQWYPKTALPDLLGVPADRVDDNRLYRALDELLPHKEALEIHLKNRMGELFDIEYDLLLDDVTSTYFEGQCLGNPLAKRGRP